MEYRIVKRYFKGDNQKTEKAYIIQYLGINTIKTFFFFKKYYQWYDYKELECLGVHIIQQIKYFPTKKKAQKYIDNLQEPVYDDEII